MLKEAKYQTRLRVAFDVLSDGSDDALPLEDVHVAYALRYANDYPNVANPFGAVRGSWMRALRHMPKDFTRETRDGVEYIRKLPGTPPAPSPATPPAPKTLNDYAAECRKAADKWWRDPRTGAKIERNKGECLMLIVSEIAEAMEGERKGLQDDKLPHRPMVEVELADAVIRIFDYAGEHGLDLEGAYREKLEYNAGRKDHSAVARLAKGGKRW